MASFTARPPTHSLDAIFVASGITALLAPFLAYLAAGAVGGYPGTGLALGLFVVPFFPIMAPLAFAFVFLCSVAVGWLLSVRGVSHVAVFMLAGAGIGLLGWGLAPSLIGLGKQPPFLARDADLVRTALVISGVAGAGAVNGALYWLVARRLSRRKVSPTDRI